MGWIEAAAELLDAIAWPVAVVAIVLVLREPIRQRIRHLRTLKWKDGEVHFDEEAAEIGRRAERGLGVKVPSARVPAEAPGVISSAWDLVDVYPRGAVIEAWLGVETELLRALQSAGVEIHRPSGGRAAQALTSEGLLGQDLAGLVKHLQRFRNEAVHAADFELSSDAATTYVATAGMLTARLSDIVAGDSQP